MEELETHVETYLYMYLLSNWQILGMTIFRDQWRYHPDWKFVQHGWRGVCRSSLLHNTDFSTQRIIPWQRPPSVAPPDIGAPHGDHWFNCRLSFRGHFPILRWLFFLDIILVKFTLNKRNIFFWFLPPARYALKSTVNFFELSFLI